MINWKGADWTLQMLEELKLLSAAFMCWQECSLRQIVLLLLCFPLTCSVHHDYFGVFLPQEGTEIGAPLAELPLPQS